MPTAQLQSQPRTTPPRSTPIDHAPTATCPCCRRLVRRLHRVRHEQHADWSAACVTCATSALSSAHGASYGGTLLLRPTRRAG